MCSPVPEGPNIRWACSYVELQFHIEAAVIPLLEVIGVCMTHPKQLFTVTSHTP